MVGMEQIRGNETNGAKYWAISENGNKYTATYSNEYFGGIMFFCIPEGVKIIGYEKRNIITFTTMQDEHFAILMNQYAKTNGYKVNNSDWFNPIILIDGKKYEYDHLDINEGSETRKITLIEVA